MGIKLFFMMLGGHIQCISEEISFIELCLTFSANIGWIIWFIHTPIARAVPDLGAVREGPYVNGKLRATGRATKF